MTLIKDIKHGPYKVGNTRRKVTTKFETDYPRVLRVILRLLGWKTVIHKGSLYEG